MSKRKTLLSALCVRCPESHICEDICPPNKEYETIIRSLVRSAKPKKCKKYAYNSSNWSYDKGVADYTENLKKRGF
jgi:hypothetical protein